MEERKIRYDFEAFVKGREKVAHTSRLCHLAAYEKLEPAPLKDWQEIAEYWERTARFVMAALSEGWLKEHSELVALREKHHDFDRDLEGVRQ